MSQHNAPATPQSRLVYMVVPHLGYGVALHTALLGVLALVIAFTVRPIGISDAFTRAVMLAPLAAGICSAPLLGVRRYRGRIVALLVISAVVALVVAVGTLHHF